jgi:hypothetical protein
VRSWLRRRLSIGIIFNTDVTTGTGKHWIAILCHFDKRSPLFGVSYYDSVAAPPPRNLCALLSDIVDITSALLGAKSQGRFPLRVNKVRRQYGDSECGVYALLFLYGGCLSGCDFDEICHGMLGDAGVRRFRAALFRDVCHLKATAPSSPATSS